MASEQDIQIEALRRNLEYLVREFFTARVLLEEAGHLLVEADYPAADELIDRIRAFLADHPTKEASDDIK